MNFALLKKNSITSFAIRIINTLTAFVISVLLSRTLGASEFGLYALGLTLIMLAATPLQAALSHLFVREIAAKKEEMGVAGVKFFIHWADKISFIYVTLILIMTGLAIYVELDLFRSSSEELASILIFGMVLVCTIPLAASRGSVLRGLDCPNLGQVPDIIIRPCILALALIIMVFIVPNSSLTAKTVMGIHGVAGCCALLFSIITSKAIIKKQNMSSVKTDAKILNPQNWMRSLKPLYLLSIMQLLNISIDIIILGIFCDNSEVGIYKVITQLGSLLAFGLVAINPIMHGRFSYLYAQKKHTELQNIVSISVTVIVLIAMPPFLILVFFSEPILGAVYGNEFIAGAEPMKFILFGQIANVAFGSVAALLNMTGHEKDTVVFMFIAALSNLLLNLLLVPKFGAYGASIAFCISMFLWNFLLWRRVRKRLDIDSSIFGVFRLPLKKFLR